LYRDNSFAIKIQKMKKLILLIAIAGFFTQAQAQKLVAKDVPTAVTIAFNKAHPSVKDAEWSKNGNYFATIYDADEGATSVTFDASGKLMENQVEISSPALPANILEYVKKNYREADMNAAYKITSANGTVTYETELKGIVLIFDSNGHFVKSLKK
jgi:hypothetical protein